LYYVLKFIGRIVILFTTRCEIRHRGNIPPEGPLLVAANHLSVGDPVLIGCNMGRKVVFMAKEELFRNRFNSYFVRSFGAFPVYRGRSNREALRQANRVLKKGQILGMFPEGKRSQENSLTPAFYGAALIAYHNKIPILPVGITGSEKIRGLSWLWHRPKVVLNIGQPFHLPVRGHSLKKEQLEEFTDMIMDNIAGLLPEKYQGKYGRPNQNGSGN
jgi:1-acyl-sn-glycerol-3-phosphate acyltransferase